ncbi:MAG: ROK family protein [Spirochaetia bacterium]|nr:ROK family protein [Spirochaetia bacterium]
MKENNEIAVGIDIGGTYIKAGVIYKSGKIIEKVKIETKHIKKNLDLINCITRILDEFFIKYPLLNKIGIGAPGPLDVNKGIMLKTPNIKGINNCSIISLLKKKYQKNNITLFLENDANCATLGQKYFGIAKKNSNFVVITLGTGVGGGLILNNQLYTGSNNNIFEIGHTHIISQEFLSDRIPLKKCGCGSYGCLETFISIKGILYYYDFFNKDNINAKKNDDVSKIAQLAQKKYKPAQKTFELAGTSLGIALSNIIYLINPPLIVITGGLSVFSDLFEKKMYDVLKKRLMKAFYQKNRIKFTNGDENSGILGAASLCFEKTSQH